MRSFWKLLIAFVLLSLLAWLILEPRGEHARFIGLKEAFRLGEIGRLTAVEESTFEQEIKALCQAAGIKQRFIVNQITGDLKDFRASLNIFITNGAEKFTHCAPGNAVYDAALNCIFIDIKLFRKDDWKIYSDGIQLNNKDLPFLDTYRRFIILHELGHYRLHGTSGGYFDLVNTRSNEQARHKEEEADQFALNGWRKFLSGADAEENIGATLDLENYVHDNDQRTAVSLIEMGNNITMGMTYGLSPYSPFYSDAAHPTYFDRIRGMIKEILLKKAMDPHILVRAEVVATRLSAMQSIADDEDVAEIDAGDQIVDAGFGADGLIIFTYATSTYLKVPYIEFGKMKSVGKIKSYRIPAINKKRTRPITDRDSKVVIFTLSDHVTYCASDDRFFKLGAQGFEDISATALGAICKEGNLFLPVADAGFVVSIPDSIFFVVKDKQNIVKKPLANIRKEINAVLSVDAKPVFRDLLINGETAAVPLKNDSVGNGLVAIAEIDLNTLKVTRVERVTLPANFFSHERQASIGYDNAENQFLYKSKGDATVVRLVKEGGLATCWQLCKATGDHVGAVLKEMPFITNKVQYKSLLAGSDSPRMYKQGVVSVGQDLFLLNWNGDSVYLINTKDNAIRSVFHPGDEQLSIRVGPDGQLIIYIKGTRKLYLINPA